MPHVPPVTGPESRGGTIITFYSYERGSGRTMALANVGWILAANGLRVLTTDWDLESPGLQYFYHPFLDQRKLNGWGITDVISRYEWAAARADSRERMSIIGEHAQLRRYTFPLDWEFANGGRLDFLPPGLQNTDYVAPISSHDWDEFYERLNGGEFFDALRADLKRNYDYVLISSPAGLSEFSDICTGHFPDVLVDCFTLNNQSIEGAAAIAQRVGQRDTIRVLPVPMFVNLTEKDRTDVGRVFAMQCFDDLPVGFSDQRRREYWAAVEVPYEAAYSYEEMLAVFGDPPGLHASLLASFERLTHELTGGTVSALPAMDEPLRKRTRLQFVRKLPSTATRIIVEFWPEDQAWGEWIAAVLLASGIEVQERDLAKTTMEGESPPDPALSVVSATYAGRSTGQCKQARPDLAVYVTDVEPPAELAAIPSAILTGVPESKGVERLRSLLASQPIGANRGHRIRYPGSEPGYARLRPGTCGSPAGKTVSGNSVRDFGKTAQKRSVPPSCTDPPELVRPKSPWSTHTDSGPSTTWYGG